MGREDYIWVAIRVFGIYLLVLSIISVPSFLSSAYSTWAMWGFSLGTTHHSDVAPIMELASKLGDAQFARLIGSAARVVLFMLAGSYLLRRGSLVFRMVSRRDPLSGQDALTHAAQPADGTGVAGDEPPR